MTALVVLVLVGVVALLDARPPAPAAADAPADGFSAGRATVAVDELAREPRPLGSPASSRSRDDIVRRLDAAGLDARVHASAGGFVKDGTMAAGAVENVVATLPGTAPSSAVLLMAHYDSVARGPGAADDMASVAAILETVRALRAGPPLRNDVVVVITDGEEAGLLGAQAWVRDELARDRRPTVALNFEASGTAGPSTLFQTSPGNAELVRAWADHVPHPTGDSALPALYALATADTDLTTVLDANRPGLNFAFSERTVEYHTAGDAPRNLSPASVQGHGDAALGLTRAFGGRDLAPLDRAVSGATDPGDRTWFRFLGTAVTYPQTLVLPFAVLAALAVLGAVAVGRLRGVLTVRGTLGAAGAALVAAALGMVATIGVWEAVLALRPAYADAGPARLLSYQLAGAAVAVFVTALWLLLLRRRPGRCATAAGGALLLAVLGLVAAFALPGTAFLFAWPALWLGVGLAAAVGLRGRPVAATAVATVGAVPVVAVLVPFAVSFTASGIADGIAGALYVLAGAAVALVLAPLARARYGEGEVDRGPRRRWAWAVPAVALVLAVVLAGTGTAVDRPSPEHPRGTMLAFAQDADTGVARWVSADDAPVGWTARYLDSPPAALAAWSRPDPVRTGPATALAVPAPEVTVLDRSAQRTVIQVRSPRGAPSVLLRADRPLSEVTVAYPGRPTVVASPDGDRVQLYALPAEGVRVTLTPAAPGPLGLTVSDVSDGLDAVPGFVPRPADLRGSADSSSDQVVLTRRVAG